MRISDWSSDVCSSDLAACPGACARRRIRRGGDLCGRACAPRKARFLHQLHPGKRGRRLHPVADRRPGVGRFRRPAAVGKLGLADSLPVFASAARHFAVDKAEAEGKPHRSEEHTSEIQSLMRISYAVFCLKKKKYNI